MVYDEKNAEHFLPHKEEKKKEAPYDEKNKIEIEFSEELKGRELKVGYILAAVKIQKSGKELSEKLEQAIKEKKENLKMEDLENIYIIQIYRKLLNEFGMDAAKLRPGNEALLRSILQNSHGTSNLADCLIISSMQTMLPVEAHDFEKIKDYVLIRKAEEGEEFSAIGSKTIMKGGELVMADSEKILDLGFSAAPSEETKVTNKTGLALIMLYAPKEIDDEFLDNAVHCLAEQLEDLIEAKILAKGMVVA